MIATYIVQVTLDNGTATKIGSTRNWKQRRKSLKVGMPNLHELLILEAPDYETALYRERLLQEVFSDYNANADRNWKSRRGDWFCHIPFANNALSDSDGTQ